MARAAMPDADLGDEALADAPTELLTDAGEVALVRRLAEWPRIIDAAAEAHEPHRVAYYLHDLASDFHAHWNRGKDDDRLRFVNSSDPRSTCARLALVRAISMVLAAGLGILGVSAPDEMR
jgi:arginyl-tRNA synthetase